MYMTEVKQRVELEKMYHNIAATHAELSLKYDELNEKNKELKRNEEKLYHMAHYDLITGLPNRKTIMDKIHELIEGSRIKVFPFYMVFIDIDSFKKINDTMGHHTGDLFIKQAADRFRKNIEEEDLIGRIGGDEFALVIRRNLSRDEVFFYLDRIRMEFIKPFMIGDYEINSSASFGVAAFPADGANQSELMKNADAAMYKAKELGKNNTQFYADSAQDN
jgi:diguanylate cyclase (GGDEF)-like protein